MVIETIIPSDFMYQFYMEYRSWARGGAKDADPVFKDYLGLCGNLSAYAHYQAVDTEMFDQLHKELEYALEKSMGIYNFHLTTEMHTCTIAARTSISTF